MSFEHASEQHPLQGCQLSASVVVVELVVEEGLQAQEPPQQHPRF